MPRRSSRAASLAALLLAATTAHATIFTVTRADDPADGTICTPTDCTLRAAILAANANAGPDTIVFSVPTSDPAGAVTLVIDRDLPALTGSGTTIDGLAVPPASVGSSAPKESPAPPRHTFLHHLRITLEPRGQVPYPYIGLTLEGTGHRVQGLAIRSFYYSQIDVHGSDHVIASNFIGIAAFERVPYRDEPFFGIRFRNLGAPVTGNVIGGTSSSGNVFGHVHTAISLVGVGAANAPANRIAGNLVGIEPDGIRMLPLTRGIELRDSVNVSVGTTAGTLDLENTIGGIGPRESVGIESIRASAGIAGNMIGGTLAPRWLPQHIERALDVDAAASVGNNWIIAGSDAPEAPDTVAFSRSLAIAPGTLGTIQTVLVRRTGPASSAASVDLRELDEAAQSMFATDPPELATGGVATLAWDVGDTSPRVVTATFVGHGNPGPYGDATQPRPYGTELRLRLENPVGVELGSIPATRLTLHAEDAVALKRFDVAVGPALGSFE